MPKKLTIEQVKQKIYQVHGNIVTLDESTYVNMHTKARFIDKDCGEFFGTVDNVVRKKCGHSKRKLEKRKKTFIEKFGVDCPSKNKEIRNKMEQTCLDRYGVKHYCQTKEYKEKVKKTCLGKYGVDSQNKVREIQQKQALSQNNSGTIKYHKTGEELIYVASYEKAFLKWINENKEELIWQIPFKMPNGKIYIVDAYLSRLNLYVEIKGRKRIDAMEKWDWFHREHPNSELWDQKKLKEKGIL